MPCCGQRGTRRSKPLARCRSDARADFVRSGTRGNSLWLMELELIEPSLYFRMGEHAAGRFAPRSTAGCQSVAVLRACERFGQPTCLREPEVSRQT